MLVSEFHFDLPPEQIAQYPPEQRGASRMLALERQTGIWQDSTFDQLPGMLRAGDVLVLNDSRVIPARLFGLRMVAGREQSLVQVETLLTEQTSEWEWRALVRPAKRIAEGQELQFPASQGGEGLHATVVAGGDFGERLIRFTPVENFFGRLDRLGHVPLPPYIRRPRQQPDQPLDRERYQTIYARQPGSVAAPTAGLHFTPQILEEIQASGVIIARVTLHVGLGTFQPVRVADVADIRLHSERYVFTEETSLALRDAVREKRRIVAAGTTTVRVLEHCAAIGRLDPHSGATSIFISPGHRFQMVDALLTNFHLPESTLLMLVCSFAGKDRTMAAYHHAVAAGYRFFSYGDCMFIT